MRPELEGKCTYSLDLTATLTAGMRAVWGPTRASLSMQCDVYGPSQTRIGRKLKLQDWLNSSAPSQSMHT